MRQTDARLIISLIIFCCFKSCCCQICTPTAHLQNCNLNENEVQFEYRRYKSNRIYAKIEKACSGTRLTYLWTLKELSSGKTILTQTQNVLYLEKYSIDMGKYEVSLDLTETTRRTRQSTKTSAKCYVEYIPSKPITFIRGGSRREAQEANSYKLEGFMSLDIDYGPGEPQRLKYTWKCLSHERLNDGLEKKSYIKIYGENATSGEYKYELSIEASSGFKESVVQEITVRKDALNVVIDCRKNCHSFGSFRINNKMGAVFRASCLNEICKGTRKDQKVTWTLSKKGETASDVLGNQWNLVLKEDEMSKRFEVGKDYILKAKMELADKNGFAEMPVSVDFVLKEGQKGACSISPTSGDTETVFEVSCIGYKDYLSYLIYQKVKGIDEFGVLISASQLPKSNVRLAKGEEINIKIVETTNYFEVQGLKVTVTNSKKHSHEHIKKSLAGKNNNLSLKHLVATGNLNDAMQIANSLIDDINALPHTDNPHKIEYKKKLVAFLNDMPIYGDYDQSQISSITSKLLAEDSENVDIELKYTLSELCRKAARQQVDSGKKTDFVMTEQAKIQEINNHLAKCALATINITPIDHVETRTTPKSKQEEAVAFEEYKDYSETEKTNLKSLFSKSIANALAVLELGGQADGQTRVPEELQQQIKRENMNINSETMTVGQLNHKRIKIEPWALKFSGPMLKDEILPNPDYISYTSIEIKKESNPYKFAKEDVKVSSSLLLFDLAHIESTEKVKDFSSSIKITTVFNSSADFEWNMTSVNIPDKNRRELEQNMNVHRIDMRQGTSLVVNFKSNDSLEYVVVANRRPNLEDFQSSFIVKDEHKKVYTPSEDRDFWFYVAVLPKLSNDKTMASLAKVDYSVMFYTIHCACWDDNALLWSSSGCMVTSIVNSKINCLCAHLSTFTIVEGELSNILNPLSIVRFKVSLRPSYIIFIFVAVLTLFFLIIFSLVVMKFSTFQKEKVIFLSDNIRTDRYAYLITITTGGSSNSGTTSNISIRLIGSKNLSKAHVLNYPDPDRHFLQKNCTDFFMLTSQNYLGEIAQIHMWSDFVGLRPLWHCSKISVCDLQTNKEYVFSVNKWLSVMKNGRRFFIVRHKDVIVKLTKCEKMRKSLLESDHQWNIFQSGDMNHGEKTTIIYSQILTMASISLLFVGMPKLRMSDTLGYGHFEMHVMVYYSAISSAFIAFFTHVIMRLLFRHSEKSNENKKAKSLAWFLLIFSIIINICFLMVFGFWISYVTSLLWLVILASSVMITVIIIENVWKFIKKCTLKDIRKRAYSYKKELAEIIKEGERQRLLLCQKFGDLVFRPYLSNKYNPLSYGLFVKRRYVEETRRNYASLLKEFIIFAIYCLAIFYLVIAHRDNNMVYNNLTMQDLLVDGNFGQTDVESVENIDDVYDYIKDTIINCIHPELWYEGWTRIDTGLMIDMSTRVLGVVQIRQLRTTPQGCSIPKVMQYLNVSCDPDWKERYNAGFDMTDVNSTEFKVIKIPYDVWAMRYENETYSKPYTGVQNVYPGSGYVVRLGRTRGNSEYILNYLRETQWLDFYTRAIFIEFWTYNANHNIFTLVKIVFESTASGSIIKTFKIKPARLLVPDITDEFLTIFFLLLFILFTLRSIAYQLISFAKEPSKYHKKLWNWFDLTILLLSIICLLCYIYDYIQIGHLIETLFHMKNNEYVNYEYVFFFHWIFTVLSASLICLCVIRLWKFLHFAKMFRLMEFTLRSALLPLFYLFVCHLFLLLTFTIPGWLMFSPRITIFKTVIDAVATILLLSVGFRDWSDFEDEVYYVFAYIYYVFFMYSSLLIATLYITVLMYHYGQAQEQFVEYEGSYNMQHYIRDEAKFQALLIKKRWTRPPRKRRLRGGFNENIDNIKHNYEVLQKPDTLRERLYDKYGKKKKSYVRPNEHRFSNAETVNKNKFELMESVALAVKHNRLRRDSTYADEDVFFDMEDVLYMILKERMRTTKEKVVFYKTQCGGDLKFVADQRIKDMEFIANKIILDPSCDDDHIKVTLLKRMEYIQTVLEQVQTVMDNIIIEGKVKPRPKY